MREFFKGAHFNDVAECDGYFYYSEITFNGLFRFSKSNMVPEYLGRFPNEEKWQWDIHSKIISMEDRLFFLPLNGRGISIYYPETKKFEFIIIKNEKNMPSKIISTVTMDDTRDTILLVPQDGGGEFVVLDTNEKSIRINDWLNDRISEMCTNAHNGQWEMFSLFCGHRINQHIYLSLSDTNRIIDVDMDREEVSIIECPYDVHFRSMTFFGGYFWFTLKENGFIRYEMEADSFIYEKSPFGIEDSRYPFLAIMQCGSKVIVVPGREKKMLIGNLGLDVICDIKMPEELSREYDNSLLFSGCIRDGSKIILYPRSANTMCVFDAEEDKTSEKTINYEKATMEHIMGEWSLQFFTYDIMTESEGLSFRDYCLGVKRGRRGNYE